MQSQIHEIGYVEDVDRSFINRNPDFHQSSRNLRQSYIINCSVNWGTEGQTSGNKNY